MDKTIQKISDTEVTITSQVIETVNIADLQSEVDRAQKNLDDFEAWVVLERQARKDRLNQAQNLNTQIATASEVATVEKPLTP